MTPSRAGTSGFTLIECLIALAVFAVAGVAFLSAVRTDLGFAIRLQDRHAALVAVENAAAEMRISGDFVKNPPEILGRRVVLSAQKALAGDGALQRITLLAVTEAGASARTSVFLPFAAGAAP